LLVTYGEVRCLFPGNIGTDIDQTCRIYTGEDHPE
jgi:hypothetical protein